MLEGRGGDWRCLDLQLDLQHSPTVHTTHSIIGLRGARRSARRLGIMLIYGIYYSPNNPISYLAPLFGSSSAQSETGERKDAVTTEM